MINIEIDLIYGELNSLTKSNKKLNLEYDKLHILFLFYYSRYKKSEKAQKKAIEKLTTYVNFFNEQESDPSFSKGLSGFGWLILHLIDNDFININIEDLLDSEIDAFLYTKRNSYLKQGKIGFEKGAIGISYYFLFRFLHTMDKKKKIEYKFKILEHIFLIENFLLNISSIDINLQNKTIINYFNFLYVIKTFSEFDGLTEFSLSIIKNHIESFKNNTKAFNFEQFLFLNNINNFQLNDTLKDLTDSRNQLLLDTQKINDYLLNLILIKKRFLTKLEKKTIYDTIYFIKNNLDFKKNEKQKTFSILGLFLIFLDDNKYNKWTEFFMIVK